LPKSKDGSRRTPSSTASRSSVSYGADAIKENKLERWPNPESRQRYRVNFSFPEFTCLCPRSGYPDFATILIEYMPGDFIVELKSLKLYLNGFRQEAISHEGIINRIFRDLNELLEPHFLKVIGDFNVRGNLKTIVTVSTDMNLSGDRQ
jgi:7-cyano-7-deazaguanine reductase